jgi:hypothetical protein
MKTLLWAVGVLAAQAGLWACAGQAARMPVENGVQQVWLCGEKKGHSPLVDKMLEVTPGEQIGTWGVESEGDCHVWTHYAARPDAD